MNKNLPEGEKQAGMQWTGTQSNSHTLDERHISTQLQHQEAK